MSTDPLFGLIEQRESELGLEGLYTLLLNFIDGGPGSDGYNRIPYLVDRMKGLAKRTGDTSLDQKLAVAEKYRVDALRQGIARSEQHILLYESFQKKRDEARKNGNPDPVLDPTCAIQHDVGLKVWKGNVADMTKRLTDPKRMISIAEKPPVVPTTTSQEATTEVHPTQVESVPDPAQRTELQGSETVQQGLSYLLAFLREKNPKIDQEKLKQMIEDQLKKIT